MEREAKHAEERRPPAFFSVLSQVKSEQFFKLHQINTKTAHSLH